jgi:hypothetical protein
VTAVQETELYKLPKQELRECYEEFPSFKMSRRGSVHKKVASVLREVAEHKKTKHEEMRLEALEMEEAEARGMARGMGVKGGAASKSFVSRKSSGVKSSGGGGGGGARPASALKKNKVGVQCVSCTMRLAHCVRLVCDASRASAQKVSQTRRGV